MSTTVLPVVVTVLVVDESVMFPPILIVLVLPKTTAPVPVPVTENPPAIVYVALDAGKREIEFAELLLNCTLLKTGAATKSGSAAFEAL